MAGGRVLVRESPDSLEQAESPVSSPKRAHKPRGSFDIEAPPAAQAADDGKSDADGEDRPLTGWRANVLWFLGRLLKVSDPRVLPITPERPLLPLSCRGAPNEAAPPLPAFLRTRYELGASLPFTALQCAFRPRGRREWIFFFLIWATVAGVVVAIAWKLLPVLIDYLLIPAINKARRPGHWQGHSWHSFLHTAPGEVESIPPPSGAGAEILLLPITRSRSRRTSPHRGSLFWSSFGSPPRPSSSS